MRTPMLMAIPFLLLGSIANPFPCFRDQQHGYSLKVDVDSVVLNVSVRDRYGRSISHLQKDDFQIFEDGVRQEIDQFVSEEAPFNTLMLLDNSGSTREYLGLIKRAAIEFTRRTKANDQIAIASFNSLVDLVQDFTDYRPTLDRAVDRIESIGGTALYDSLLICINRYMRDVGVRSAIVVFTDGFDNQLEGPNSEGSRIPFEQLYRRIQEVEPIIYTILLNTGRLPRVPRASATSRPPAGVGWPFPAPRDAAPDPTPDRPTGRDLYETARQHLYLIAEQTGGRMYMLTGTESLSATYAEIADDLSARYQLAYYPTNRSHDGKWRQIRIRINGRTDVAVRCRRGYYGN